MLLQLIILLPYTKQVDKHIDCLPLQPFLVFSDITQFFNLDIHILHNFFTMSNQALFCSSSKVNREIFKNYSDILMEQQALRLCHYYQVVCFLLFLSYTQNIYLLLSFCHLIITSITIFTHVIIQFISILIPQTCCCHRSCPYTITDYTSTYQNFLQCIANKCVIDFGYTWPKRYIILKG